jgi:hypothetical protein
MSGLELIVPAIMSGVASAGTAAGSALASATPWLAAGGTALTAAGGLAAANQQKAAAKTEALGLQAAASDERAAAGRQAEEERRRTNFVLSKQRANAAASGAGVTGTVLDLLGDTAAEGKYASKTVMDLGNARAAGLSDKSRATRKRASADYGGSLLSAGGDAAMGMYRAFG